MRLSPVLPPGFRAERGPSVPQRRVAPEQRFPSWRPPERQGREEQASPEAPSRAPDRAPRQTQHARPSGASTDPVRAVAVAHERCNAVGTVELSCGPKGLWVRFVRISAFTDGYVPYPAIAGHSITVPYDQVVRVATDPEGLVHLTLDPSSTPFHRLVLAGLVRETTFDHHFSWLQRARFEHAVTLAAIASWLPIAAGLKALVPALSELLVLSIAATIALLFNGMRRAIASRLVLFSTRTERVRSELVSDLSLRLGPSRVQDLMTPGVAVASGQTAERAPERVAAPEGGGLGPLFATAGIVAAVALLAILVGRTIWLQPREAELLPAGDPSSAAGGPSNLSSAPPTPITPEPPRPVVQLPPCSCDRSESALWADGVPKLSVLSTNRPGKSSARKPSVYPEIAVVNNANEDLKNVMLTVDFSQSASEGHPARHTGEQGLLYDGVLGPGQAVKWRTKGRGDEYTVTSSVSGKLGESGVQPAPADAFQKLLNARTPSVRLHGAKMLAWLGDPRAREAVELLEREHRQDMEQSLSLIADALRPVRVCQPRITQGPTSSSVRLEVCVFNASEEAHDRPALVARTGQGMDVQETRWIVEAPLPPGAGVRTTGTLDAAGDLESVAASLRLVAEP